MGGEFTLFSDFDVENLSFFAIFFLRRTSQTSDPMYRGSNTQQGDKFLLISALHICPHNWSRGLKAIAHFYEIRPPPTNISPYNIPYPNGTPKMAPPMAPPRREAPALRSSSVYFAKYIAKSKNLINYS